MSQLPFPHFSFFLPNFLLPFSSALPSPPSASNSPIYRLPYARPLCALMGYGSCCPSPRAVIPPQPWIKNGLLVRTGNDLSLGVGRGSQNHLEEEEVPEGAAE